MSFVAMSGITTIQGLLGSTDRVNADSIGWIQSGSDVIVYANTDSSSHRQDSSSGYELEIVLSTGSSSAAATLANALSAADFLLAPAINVPGAQALKAGTATSIAGISITDNGNTSGDFTVTLTDSYGMLSASATGGGDVVSGSGSPDLTIAGTYSQINTDLGTLKDTATAGSDTITVNATDGFGDAALPQTIAVLALSGPTGVGFALDAAAVPTLTASNRLNCGDEIGTFLATGDGAGATFTYSPIAIISKPGGAPTTPFSVNSATGILTVGGTTFSNSGLYQLSETATDQAGLSFTQPFDVWLGTGASDTVSNLATTEGNTTTPTVVYALATTESITTGAMSGNVWIVGGTSNALTVTGTGMTGALTVVLPYANFTSAHTAITGGGGNNTIELTDTGGVTVTDAQFTHVTGVEVLELLGNSNTNSVTLGGTSGGKVSADVSGTGRVFTVDDSAATNTLTLDAHLLSSNTTLDVILSSWLSTDSLTGGPGTSDTLLLTDSGATDDLTTGTFTGFEDITLSGSNDTLTLNNNNLSVTVTGTGDTVILGGGTDTVAGGSGNTVTLGGSTDTVSFAGGTNTVNAVGGGTVNGLGGASATLNNNDIISGGTGADSLSLDVSGSNSGHPTYNFTFGDGTHTDIGLTNFENLTVTGAGFNGSSHTDNIKLTFDSHFNNSGTLTVDASALTNLQSLTLDVSQVASATFVMAGNGGNNIFDFAAGDTALTFSGTGTNGAISGYDTITDYAPTGSASTSEKIGYASVAIAANAGTTIGNHASTLEVENSGSPAVVIKDQITSGIMTFDTNSSGFTAVTLQSISDVAAVVQYLQENSGQNGVDGTSGRAIGFVATISGVTNTFVYIRGSTNANDVLIDLQHVSPTSLSTSGLTNQLAVLGSTAPSGIAGQPINLALTDPSGVGAPTTVTISGMPVDWSLNQGTNNGNGTWTVETDDLSALTVLTAAAYAGATVLGVTETWANADGTTGTAFVSDNVEAYVPGSPIFAWSGDDTLTGAGGNDLFVFDQPIGNDTIYNFNVASDQIDLTGFAGIAGFGDLAGHIADAANGDAVDHARRRRDDYLA